MKIRNGFVSNSSSSSFVIVGVQPTSINFEKLCESLDVKNLEPYTKFSCCGKKVSSQFCPACGKPKLEMEGIVDYKRVYYDHLPYKHDGPRVFDEDSYSINNLFGFELSSVSTVEKIIECKDILEKMGYNNVKVYSGETCNY